MTESITDSASVFISYAKEDFDAVFELVSALEAANIDVWFDRKDLLPGQSWKDVIEIAIEKSSLFIFCLSHHSCSKTGFVQHEIRHAYEQAKLRPEHEVYIVPVRLDDCEPPRSLRELQYIDAFAPHGISKLVFSVKQHLNWLPKPVQGRSTRSLADAVELALTADEQYVLAGQLLAKEWHERYSAKLTFPRFILPCLEPFEVKALSTIHQYAQQDKYGTFSAKLTEDGELWLRKALSFKLVRQLTRTDNPHSGFERTVTLALTETGRDVLVTNERSPVRPLIAPPLLSHLPLFQLHLADDLSWKAEMPDRLVRLRKNSHWNELLSSLIQANLFSLEHETDRYLTLKVGSDCYRIGNFSAAISQNKFLCPIHELDGDHFVFLIKLRDRQRSATLPYVSLKGAELKASDSALRRLVEDELIATHNRGSTTAVMVMPLGFSVTQEGTFEEWESTKKREVFEDTRPLSTIRITSERPNEESIDILSSLKKRFEEGVSNDVVALLVKADDDRDCFELQVVFSCTEGEETLIRTYDLSKFVPVQGSLLDDCTSVEDAARVASESLHEGSLARETEVFTEEFREIILSVWG